ncbi:MAG: hypothetical protein Athens101410_192 [Parcubacteria group bacterium Athens1014_10]|nr:MAG: hypothetical protein Athens101410_192 [Parcubacteria group bacterium Athens1014_10]TSD05556.1 MAG: hypothetical protein Athens071412_257 [Parcubacteria group bacterium Athens0714_12]
MFNSFFQNTEVLTTIFNLTFSFALAFVIAFTYQKTHKGLSYSQGFVLTIIVLCVLAAAIMMIIGSSVARAFAMLGAFTIIRFRTAVKDTKDTAFILFGLIVGMAVGINNYSVALTTTIFVSLLLYFLDKFNFGSVKKYDYILSFSVDKEKNPNNGYEEILKDHLKNYDLLNISTRDDGKIIDINFSIRFLAGINPNKLIEILSNLSGIENIHLIMAKDDIEY